eukprot:2724298-Prymnesium_polylepis.1
MEGATDKRTPESPHRGDRAEIMGTLIGILSLWTGAGQRTPRNVLLSATALSPLPAHSLHDGTRPTVHGRELPPPPAPSACPSVCGWCAPGARPQNPGKEVLIDAVPRAGAPLCRSVCVSRARLRRGVLAASSRPAPPGGGHA